MKKNKLFVGQYWLPIFSLSMFLFLYIPIVVLIFFSFNSSAFVYVWKGLTLKWYYELVEAADLINAAKNSFIIAFSAVCLSLTFGTCFVFFRTKRYTQQLLLLSYTSLALPEVVLAVGLLSFFTYFSVDLGLTTLIAGHTLMGLAYTIPILQSRFVELDVHYNEASVDLGATQFQTLRYIMVPLLSPALIASGLLVFIVSLDDFVISFFIAGPSTQTLPLYIFSVIRSGTTPIVNALSTLLLLVSSIAVLLFAWLKIRKVDLI
jgi:spermidine/putrescine transport system permease protein